MIAPQELKQNNLIRDIESGRIGAVLTIGEKKCTIKMPYSKLSQSYEEFEPIDLNEDWLLRFGYDRNKNEYCISGHDRFNVFQSVKGPYIFCDDEKSIKYVKHVHELQNLFFALIFVKISIV
ncbi:hypothetical protein ACVVIH_13000 [Chryseobacterium arthrosphaerae]